MRFVCFGDVVQGFVIVHPLAHEAQQHARRDLPCVGGCGLGFVVSIFLSPLVLVRAVHLYSVQVKI